MVWYICEVIGRIFFVSSREAMPKDPEGRLYIDRSGYLFGMILDYLRTGFYIISFVFF
jgi:hypothetical protein